MYIFGKWQYVYLKGFAMYKAGVNTLAINYPSTDLNTKKCLNGCYCQKTVQFLNSFILQDEIFILKWSRLLKTIQVG
jgi:hypothetical protein